MSNDTYKEALLIALKTMETQVEIIAKFIRILESYERMIKRSGKEFPEVVLDDIRASIEFVLKEIGGKE